MSERLYYDDAYTTQFEATVTNVLTQEGRPAVLLDRTFFYPTSGGQQHDLGTVDGVAVIDVQVTPEGEVLHLLAQPLTIKNPVKNPVRGEIDWIRRYDHMQQHSGQHLLSQAFYQMFGLETLSVHFGDTICTLDLDTEEIDNDTLAAVEDHSNTQVWQNRPIRCYWVNDIELSSVPLRRPPKVSGQIRIVEISDYDWSACGGTHVRQTSEIGLISLLRTEKMRRQVRVHFVCGGRALRDARQRRSILSDTAALLDTHHEQVPALIEKLQTQNRESERSLRTLQEELLAYRAKALLASARPIGNVQLVAQVEPDLDANALKSLAYLLQAEPHTVALLCCASGDKGTAIFARADDVDLNVGQLLREVLRPFGGGGGGRPDFAQGGGMAADKLADVLAAAVQQVEASLS